MGEKKKLNVAIYGVNGHQIWGFLEDDPYVNFVCAAAVPEEKLSRYSAYANGSLKKFDSLDEMIENESENIDLICLCSPRRKDQAVDAVKCLRKGISVYAEKPAALSEQELDFVLSEEKKARLTYPNVEFHEIADTGFFEPYSSMHKLILDEEIGEIVQIYAQKSYPNNYAARPEDDNIDGGITRQVGIHALRFIEHVCCCEIEDLNCVETNHGAPSGRSIVIASSMICRLKNGGVASVCLNYCNPESFGLWGNESIRVFGTKGVIELTDAGKRTHIWTKESDLGSFHDSAKKCKHFFTLLCEHLLFGNQMPFDQEVELHPLRMVIRAHDKALINNSLFLL